MAKAFCTTKTTVNEQTTLPPSGSAVQAGVKAYYDQVAREGGVLLRAEEIELRLQQDFVTGVAGLASSLPKLGNYNRLESALATLLGWKRWLWQSTKTGTGAGLAREALLERANSAQELVRLLALHKSLPLVRQMQARLFELAPKELPRTRLLELLYDQIVVGNLGKLRNVTDSPLVLERATQRYLKHQDNLAQAGLDTATVEQLERLSVQISETFDEVRFAAGQAGLNVDILANGGYFPLRATQEFANALAEGKETFVKGFKPLEELVQKQRKTNVPVVADLDTVARLFQKQLLKTDLDASKLANMSAKELSALAEAAESVQKQGADIRSALEAKKATQLEKLERSLNKKQTQALAVVRREWKERIKTQVQEAKASALAEGTYTKTQVNQIAAEAKAKATAAMESALEEAEQKFANKVYKAQARLDSLYEREAVKQTQALYKSQSQEVQVMLNHERAKLRLLEINASPGELSELLASLGERQLQRLFDSGVLAQLPAMSDELSEFYKGFDLGVRGLSDAIQLDPVQAIRAYSDDLSEAAKEQQLFKTAFDLGGQAGWVKASVEPTEAANYIKVGNSAKLRKWVDNSEVLKGIGDLYIHRTAADQLDALLQINTSPAAQASVGQAVSQFFAFNRRSLIVNGGVGYVKRVFAQNAIALFASTGSVAQLPFAMVDALRSVSGKWDWGKQTDKVFTIGNQSYTVPELMREVLLRRGGSASASLNDPRSLVDGLFTQFDQLSVDRARHFNALHTKQLGNPVTGAVAKAGRGTAKAFQTAYGVLAFANGFLDNAFRWAAVRELATSGRFDNLDDMLRYLDNYYSVNADGGKIGQALGNFYMPFAQFAINAPGAALRHAINNPWRAASTMQLYAQASGTGSDLSEGELPPYLRNSKDYFFTLYRDPNTGKHGVVMPQSVDFMLDSYTWMAQLTRDLAGAPTGVGDYVDKSLNPFDTLTTTFQELVAKTYAGNVGLALLGIDPRSLESYEASSEGDTVLGVPVTKAMRSAIVNLLPLVRTLDQNLPTSVVGQAPVAPGVEFGTPQQPDAGVPGWLGAVPTTGGTRNKRIQPGGELFTALTGLSVSEIDPAKNLIGTYKDFDSRLREIRKNRRKLHKRLTVAGAKPTQHEYDTYDRLLELEVVLGANKLKLDRKAASLGLLPPRLWEQLDGKLTELVNEPLDAESQLLILQELENE